MAMGEPIGQAALLTQNNRPGGIYPPQLNAGAGQVHIALMGDPTLRMHPWSPPANLNGAVNASGVTFTGERSSDGAVSGYYIYKSNSESGSFVRISQSERSCYIIHGFSRRRSEPLYGSRLETGANPGGFIFQFEPGNLFSRSDQRPRTLHRHLAIWKSCRSVQGGVILQWINTSQDVRSFEIQRRTLPGSTFTKIGVGARHRIIIF